MGFPDPGMQCCAQLFQALFFAQTCRADRVIPHDNYLASEKSHPSIRRATSCGLVRDGKITVLLRCLGEVLYFCSTAEAS